MIHNEKQNQHVHFKYVNFFTINSVAFYMFGPADTAKPLPLGWYRRTHSISTHNLTQMILSIFYISTYILKLLYKTQHYTFVSCLTFCVIYPSKNTSLKMATVGGRNMWEATLLIIQ